MPAGDLLTVVVADPVRLHLEAVLAPRLPASVVAGAGALVDAAAVAVLGVLLASAGRALATVRERQGDSRGGRLLGDALCTGGLVVAAALFTWIAWHPSTHIHEVFARGDHLAFAVLAGCALVRAPLPWRPWLVTLLSLAFLCQYSGPLAVAVALA